jgi:hypothetical protein
MVLVVLSLSLPFFGFDFFFEVAADGVGGVEPAGLTL